MPWYDIKLLLIVRNICFNYMFRFFFNHFRLSSNFPFIICTSSCVIWYILDFITWQLLLFPVFHTVTSEIITWLVLNSLIVYTSAKKKMWVLQIYFSRNMQISLIYHLIYLCCCMKCFISPTLSFIGTLDLYLTWKHLTLNISIRLGNVIEFLCIRY